MFAGSPSGVGFADGAGVLALFANPYAAAFTPAGDLVVVDVSNARIRLVSPLGMVTTLAGSPYGASTPFLDGTGSQATFNFPTGVAVVPGPSNPLGAGNYVVADRNNQRLRLLTPAGIVTTLAGSGATGANDGSSSSASFNQPWGVAIDAAGVVFVSDSAGHRVRAVFPNATVVTVAGSGAATFIDGPGTQAAFNVPSGIIVDATAPGRLFVCDRSNSRIRIVTWPGGMVSTIASAGGNWHADGPALLANINGPMSIAQEPSGSLVFTEIGWPRVRRLTLGNWVVSTVAGTGMSGFSSGSTLTAMLNNVYGVAVSRNGSIFITEGNSGSIFNGVRAIVCASPSPSPSPSIGAAPSVSGTPTPPPTPSPTTTAMVPSCVVTTVAGVGTVIGNLDGVGSSAQFNQPTGLVWDGAFGIIVADRNNGRIRIIDTRTSAVTTLAGGAGGSIDSTGAAAGFNGPFGVCMSTDRTAVFVAENAGNRVRRVSYPGGVTTTFAFSGAAGYLDGPWFVAQINGPTACVAGPANTLYVVEANNNRIRVVANENVYTLAGSGGPGYSDGASLSAMFRLPLFIAIDPTGILYVSTAANGVPNDNHIRTITPGGVVSTLSGSDVNGLADGSAPSFRAPNGLAFDASGSTLIVADGEAKRHRRGSVWFGKQMCQRSGAVCVCCRCAVGKS